MASVGLLANMSCRACLGLSINIGAEPSILFGTGAHEPDLLTHPFKAR
jgi:hypothetical protein